MVVRRARTTGRAEPATKIPSELPAGDAAIPVRIRGAARRFGARVVFTGLDLDLASGERLFLKGANGSGKTTLLRCLAGTLGLQAGSIAIAGFPAGSRGARARVGLCLNPEQALYSRLSGHDNLMFAARLAVAPNDISDAVDLVEREMGITEFADNKVKLYSSGMRSRVAIARALLGRPGLLLLDEPTRSLDRDARDRLWAALAHRNVACVIASHHDSDRTRCDSELDLSRYG